jgi:hypothetical protein
MSLLFLQLQSFNTGAALADFVTVVNAAPAAVAFRGEVAVAFSSDTIRCTAHMPQHFLPLSLHATRRHLDDSEYCKANVPCT